LANILGNLVNRTISMANKYFDGKIEYRETLESIDENLLESINSLESKVKSKMDHLEIGLAIDEIFDLLRKCNKYIDETMPWVLAKEESQKERLQTVLYNLLESIRIGSVFLGAFLPETSEKIFNQLNTGNRDIDSVKSFGYIEEGNVLNKPEPLFMRIEK